MLNPEYYTMLKTVPTYTPINPFVGGFSDNPRWFFFQNQGVYDRTGEGTGTASLIFNSIKNNPNMYCRKNGDQYEYLGKFIKIECPTNQTRSNAFKGFLEYKIYFDKPYNTMTDELYYIDKIYWLLEDCKKYGTLPFASLARCAFISTEILNSFVEENIITD